MENRKADRLIELVENGIGDYLRTYREAKGYLQEEICDGICSVPTLSRIEAGGKIVDFLMIEAFLSRMKIERSEYEFVLDEEDYYAYKRREEIEILVKNRNYEQAEKCMEVYRKQYVAEKLHGQFLAFQEALLEKAKSKPEWGKVRKLFLGALAVTAPEHRKKFEKREILSNLELSCITEIIYCIEERGDREKEYEELYAYFTWNCKREGFFPLPYRSAMQYYAECLYKNGKYERCVQICDEAIKELFRTSKAENRGELFLLRAKAREEKGNMTQEESSLCIKDFLTAYHIISFYGGESKARALEQYIGGKYGWQFIG